MTAQDGGNVVSATAGSFLVKPDSVRVSAWYMAKEFASDPQNGRSKWRARMGQVFIPSVVQLMSPIGLTAYIPTILPVDSCAQVPDEIAIVFFQSKEIYYSRTQSTAGRVFGAPMHESVFDMSKDNPAKISFTDFPAPMPTDLVADQPYYVFDNEADWYNGPIDVFVGARPDSMDPAALLKATREAMSQLQQTRPEDLLGLLFFVRNDCLIYWALWKGASTAREGLLKDLRAQLRTVLATSSKSAVIPGNPSAFFPGVTVQDGDSLALNFPRTWASSHMNTEPYPKPGLAELYWIKAGTERDKLLLERAPDPALKGKYTAILPISINGSDFLYCYDRTDQQLDIYYVDRSSTTMKLVAGYAFQDAWDLVQSFTFGARQYLLGYASEEGVLSFWEIGDDLSLTQTYTYSDDRGTQTQGFTTLQPFNYRGDQFLLGYKIDTGDAAIFQLKSVVWGPLQLNAIWGKNWAQGWTRFAFFLFGGENYFLKTNIKYNTVNIDHIVDDPTQGTHEVGKHLPLDQTLDRVASFLILKDPCFLTYKQSGQLTLNRVNADCRGWVQQAAAEVGQNATLTVPFTSNYKNLLLIYQG